MARKAGAASAARLNQIAVAGIVALLGVSHMFNSMDRQVFPTLLSAMISQYGLTLPQAGFVSTVFTIMVALFGNAQRLATSFAKTYPAHGPGV